MKKILCYIAVVILILCVGMLPAFATESEGADAVTDITEKESFEATESVTKHVTETNTESVTVAQPDAETEPNVETETHIETETAVPTIGDRIISELASDPQFWAVVIMGLVMVVVMIAVLFVLLANTNPTTRKSMRGMNKAVDIVTNIKKENSQTLEDLKKSAEESYIGSEEKLLKIIELEEQIKELTQRNAQEKRNLLTALAYDMRMHKLICDRLPMPVNDKSLIDMWYASGIDYIKDDLNAEDIAKINSMFSILDEVGKKK